MTNPEAFLSLKRGDRNDLFLLHWDLPVLHGVEVYEDGDPVSRQFRVAYEKQIDIKDCFL